MIAIDVADTEAALDAVATEWEALADAHGLSPFQTFAWQRAWWRHLGSALPEARLHVVLARSGGELVGIAPLFTERVGGILGVRRLAFVGRGGSDYLDVLLRRDAAHDAASAIVDHVLREVDFEVGSLDDVSDRSHALPALMAALCERGREPRVLLSARCPRTRLAATWEETLASFSVTRRREVRRRRRNLEKAASIALEVRGDADTIGPDLAEVVSMHQERWTSSGHAGAMGDAAVRRMHEEVALALARRGRAFLAFLRADGRRLAALYGFRWRGELAIYLTGQRDPGALQRHSPGRVLTAMAMERAIEEGCSYYDFMRGAEAYKYELEGRDVLNRTLVFSGRGRLARERYGLALLGESLGRRAGIELRLWRHATSERGAASRASLAYLASRARVVAQDGAQKLRQPGAPVDRGPR